VYATTAKDTGDAGGATTSQLMNPEIKLAGWLSIIPVQAKANEPDPVTPDPEDPNQPEDPTTPDDDGDDQAGGQQLGGCSTGSSTGGIATMFLIGLAAFIRRRRA
jgi:MYXO-CTERM domain-containing protein